MSSFGVMLDCASVHAHPVFMFRVSLLPVVKVVKSGKGWSLVHARARVPGGGVDEGVPALLNNAAQSVGRDVDP